MHTFWGGTFFLSDRMMTSLLYTVCCYYVNILLTWWHLDTITHNKHNAQMYGYFIVKGPIVYKTYYLAHLFLSKNVWTKFLNTICMHVLKNKLCSGTHGQGAKVFRSLCGLCHCSGIKTNRFELEMGLTWHIWNNVMWINKIWQK